MILFFGTCTNLIALPEVYKIEMGHYSDSWKAHNKGRSPAEFFLENIGSLCEIFNIWLPYWWLLDVINQMLL